VLLFGWGRAILMQIAHPLVARGIAEHSAFGAELFGGWRRLHRTLGAMLSLTFGDDAAARRAADRINAIHARVNGRLGAAEGVFAAGTPYSACDPALLGWVHATLVDSFPLAYELYVGPLTQAERDAYCAESTAVEPRLGIPSGVLPRTRTDLEAQIAARLASGEIRVADTARGLARQILFPPMSAPAWPALALLRLTTVGLLPPALRAQFGFSWGPGHARALRASAAVVRGVLPVVPSALRHWPAARAAARRRAA
jgi:uncharacterized protein (DUF2236 family)